MPFGSGAVRSFANDVKGHPPRIYSAELANQL